MNRENIITIKEATHSKIFRTALLMFSAGAVLYMLMMLCGGLPTSAIIFTAVMDTPNFVGLLLCIFIAVSLMILSASLWIAARKDDFRFLKAALYVFISQIAVLWIFCIYGNDLSLHLEKMGCSTGLTWFYNIIPTAFIVWLLFEVRYVGKDIRTIQTVLFSAVCTAESLYYAVLVLSYILPEFTEQRSWWIYDDKTGDGYILERQAEISKYFEVPIGIFMCIAFILFIIVMIKSNRRRIISLENDRMN